MKKTASQIADEVLAKIAQPPTPAQVAAMKSQGAQVQKQQRQGMLGSIRKNVGGTGAPAGTATTAQGGMVQAGR